LRKALRKLAGYLPEFHAIDTARLYREGLGALELVVECRAIERYPRFWML
jgi:hypothetical protein